MQVNFVVKKTSVPPEPEPTYIPTLAIAHDTTPFVTMYDETLGKIANPSSLPPGDCLDVTYNATGQLMAVASETSPQVTVYETTNWTKLGPLAAVGGQAYRVDFNTSGTMLAVAHIGSPYLTVFETTTWTKISGIPSPSDTGRGVSFSFDDTKLAYVSNSSPWIHVYKTIDWTLTEDIPALSGGAAGRCCEFSPNGSFLAVSTSGGDYTTVYRTSDWSIITGTNFALRDAFDISFSPDSSLMAVVYYYSSPTIVIYNTTDWSAISGPTSIPTSVASGVSFSHDGTMLAVSSPSTGTAFPGTAGVSNYTKLYLYDTSDWSLMSNPPNVTYNYMSRANRVKFGKKQE